MAKGERARAFVDECLYTDTYIHTFIYVFLPLFGSNGGRESLLLKTYTILASCKASHVHVFYVCVCVRELRGVKRESTLT